MSEHLCDRDTSGVTKSMIDVADYADTVEWSSELHFSFTPKQKCSPFNMERDCGSDGRCIVSAIGNYTVRATDAELTMEKRAEAIKFLVHFVADIHNPMHIGFSQDRGGNDILLAYPAGKSLHNVWDYVLVNHQQRKYGVYKNDDQADGKQPWELSNALLGELKDRGSVNLYKMKIDLEDVSSLEAATRLAAQMASFTAQQFTCTWAYKNNKNQWIQSGDTLELEYIDSRSENAMELLKFAGIRLAQLLNTIAKVCAKRKYLLKEAVVTRSQISKRDTNIFVTLEFDFDPDKYLYLPEELSSFAQLVASKKSVSRKSKMSKNIKKRDPVPYAEPMESNPVMSERKECIFEGIDLSSIVLVERGGRLILTSRGLVEKNAFGRAMRGIRVAFAGNAKEKQSFDFDFDMEVFGYTNIRRDLVARTLAYIRNVEIQSMLPPSLSEGDVSVEFRSYQQIAPYQGLAVDYRFEPVPISLTPKSFDDIAANILFFNHRTVTLFVLRDTLQAHDPVLKTFVYQVAGPEVVCIEYFLVDENMMGKYVTVEFLALLAELRKTPIHKPSLDAMVTHRRSIIYELSDLNTLFYGKEFFRTLDLQVIKWLKFSTGSFDRLHWSVSPLPRAADIHGSPIDEGIPSQVNEKPNFPIAWLILLALVTYAAYCWNP